MLKKFVSVVAAATLVAIFAVSTAQAGPNQTGQGIMVNLTGGGTFAVHETDTYHFNVATAGTYYTNLWDGVVPTPTCSGPGCSLSTAPVAPVAPTPDATQVMGHESSSGDSGQAHTDHCIFLDGGTLGSMSYAQSVSLTVDVPALCGSKSCTKKATYTWTYGYDVVPTGTVAAFTAWDLVDVNGGGAADVVIGADIAGESVLKSAKQGTKFSFSLLESDGSNRVQNLHVMVLDDLLNVVAEGYPGSTVMYPVDFLYTTNAGSNGVTSLLLNGDARTILNNDSFAGNNDGGADGSALALAVMDGVDASLMPGEYTGTLTGTVKGNAANTAGGSDISFFISQLIHIVTPGCSAP